MNSRLKFIVILVACAITVAVFAARRETTIHNEIATEKVPGIDQAYRALYENRFEEAEYLLMNELRLSLGKSDTREIIRLSADISRLMISLGRYEDAESFLKDITTGSSTSPEAKVYLRGIEQCGAGRIQIRKGRYAQADGLLKECMTFFAKNRHNYPDHYGDALHLMGLNLQEQGKPEESLIYYNLALEYRRKHDAASRLSKAATLNNIGNIYWKMGEYGRALSFHERSLLFKKALLQQSHPDISASLNNIGVLLNDSGEFELALEYHQKALLHRQQTLGNHPSTAHSMHNLGESYFHLGQIQKALEYLNAALILKAETVGTTHNDYINSLAVKANIESYMGHTLIADSLFNISFDFCYNLSSIMCLNSSVFFTSHLIRNGKLELAQVNEQKIYETIAATYGPRHPLLAKLYIDLAKAFDANEDYATAIGYAQKVVRTVTGVGLDQINPSIFTASTMLDRDLLLEALTIMSRNYQRSFNKSASIAQLLKALQASKASLLVLDESLADPYTDISLSRSESKSSALTQQALDVTFLLFNETRDEQYLKEGFEIVDYGQNWLLQTQLSDLDAMSQAGAPDEIIDQTKSLIFQLIDAERKYSSEESIRSRSEDMDLAEEIFSLKESLARSKKQLQINFPLYKDFRSNRPSYYTSNLHSYLGNINGVLIEYFTIRDTLYAFVINGHEIALEKLDSSKFVRDLAEMFRGAVLRREPDGFPRYSHMLYSSLLKPLEEYLTNNLIIVPNSDTQSISFESLIPSLNQQIVKRDGTRRNRFVIDEHEVTYTYSAASLLSTSSDVAVSFENELLALAPIFDRHSPISDTVGRFLRKNSFSPGTDGYSVVPLPGTEKEITLLEQVITRSKNAQGSNRPRSVKILLRDEATETVFKSLDLSSYRYLHLATHSFAVSDEPLGSGILLELSGSAQDDGILYASEIFGLDVKAELVVLSACDTALGSSSGTVSLSGFARGFLFAGARNLVASLWPSDDLGTQILMQQFYAHLMSGVSIPTALRRAKLQLLNDDGPISHPYYWSGFVHIGSPSISSVVTSS